MIKYPYYIGVKGQEYFWFPGLLNEWFEPETGKWVTTVAFGVTSANEVMKLIHNSKQRMPSILTDDLAWKWMMIKPVDGKLTPAMEARLSEIALTQIHSRLIEVCTIDKDYRLSKEGTPIEYSELPPLDMTFVGLEELAFDHWGAVEKV